jgi:hypothetical protein
MKLILLVCILTISNFNPIYGQTNATMEKLFLDLETKWMNAWKNKDEVTARKLLADEFTLTSSLSSQDLVNKETWIDKAIHQYDCKDFRIDKLQVRTYGNTAVLNIWFYQDAVANGKDWSGHFALTDVWVKKEQEWQVVARHATWLQNK